jgi:hypothetical protein
MVRNFYGTRRIVAVRETALATVFGVGPPEKRLNTKKLLGDDQLL